MSFKLNVDDFEGQSIQSVVTIVDNAFKKPLSEVLLYDLLLNETTDKALRHGVYMYFNDKNECVYVGMCSSSHFAHRIGGHFGMSPKYGMNTFLKRTVKMLGFQTDKYESYVEALPKISNYGLLIINANTKGKSFITKLEKLFHIAYKPELNFPKGFPKKYMPLAYDEDFMTSLSSI
ncbi:hypothetical protein ACRWQN_11375 [Shewanella sp. HL-SH8]|jgi:hypothetical protein|uniref:hypothetical protein n=1 Tax=Shewanella sp. HL-SH8 TaxID=3436242 RepID=UPI003EC0AF10